MPALSPTMTEGNIATWKVKEGDSFQAGDILLEIETDKATMDVEAQDPGVMVKIFKSDGEKSVQVGTRIAVIGEEGDDPKSLDIPEDDSKPMSKSEEAPKEEQQTSGGEEKAVQAQKDEGSSPPGKSSAAASAPQGPGQNKKYPLYPSVIALIHEKHIPESEISKITATGPQGRLLKGDVLAYLGTIPSDYSSKQSQRITHMGHLDLSNIKILEKAPPKPAETAAPQALAPTPELPAITEVSLPISLSAVLATQKRIEDTIRVTIPLSTFLARATELANTDLPRTKESMETDADDLFNSILGLDVLNPKTSHGAFIPQITAFPSTSTPKPKKVASSSTKQPDIIDILSGKTKTTKSKPSTTFASPVSTSTAGAVNLFSLIVPKEDEKRAKVFLERVKTVLQSEPGKLVL
ncbi:putative pyruvate dehydrogenase protein x component [Phaeomoniella chlamydospora]|uniref:Putative pyruvate dehydrogenase protein x component n=1 Tax=Phaeomoniella chlamydospora TaxID=158046 RepID=A0A0G2DTJ1_PHACM|nr:putative pyruvate dehydrogenase protein x component [Phaeomoniella chlamydospora]